MSMGAVTPLRHRMIEDMNGRKLCAGTQRGHIHSCKRFAAFLNRSPDTATSEDIRRFQLHLAETGVSICNRNRIMTGLRFLFRVTLRRLDLANEVYHIREPQKIPLVRARRGRRRTPSVRRGGRRGACPGTIVGTSAREPVRAERTLGGSTPSACRRERCRRPGRSCARADDGSSPSPSCGVQR